MSLVKCKECRSMISDQALTCPSCGAPTAFAEKVVRRKQRNNKWLWFGAIVLVVCIFLGSIVWLPIFARDEFSKYLVFGELAYDEICSTIAQIIALGGLCVFIAKDKPRKYKLTCRGIFVAYCIMIGGFILYEYYGAYMPLREFKDKFCSRDIAKNLQGVKMSWDKDIVLSFSEDSIQIFVNNKSFSLPIDSITADGEICVNCKVEEVKSIFGKLYGHYFSVNELPSKNHVSISGFTITSRIDYNPSGDNSNGFDIRYRGYYSESKIVGEHYVHTRFGMGSYPETRLEWYEDSGDGELQIIE